MLSETNKLDKALGFYNTWSRPELLKELEPYSYAVLFIGLIFDLILIILVVVAVLLIYSLLLISVETKTFEIGVMRLIGLTKKGFVAMIITQAIMFVLPAVVMGFACAIPIIYFLYDTLFKESLGYMPSIIPSGWAIGRALIVGILIPLLSSIIPIRRALSANLVEALDSNRSKSQAVLVTFIDNKTKDVLPFILFGSVAVVFGMSIYYGLPAAMLELNLGLILSIFFLILMGLLFGLTLFAVNL